MGAGAYAWWYVDALSDAQPDGSAYALTLIAFVGSVFSPYYAWARRRHGDAGAPAEAHCAVNVSLYRRAPGRTRFERLWAMTERDASRVQRTEHELHIGPSHLAWRSDDSLCMALDEWTVPWPSRLRGRIRLSPQQWPCQSFALDAAGRHQWQPISPRGRIELDFDSPRLRWQGDAYMDANHGTRPLERDFESWQWSRSALSDQRSRLIYEVRTVEGGARAVALEVSADGRIHSRAMPANHCLPATAWGVARSSRAEQRPDLLATLESGPFYSRSLLRDPGDGAWTMHESLSLTRFTQPWVQAMLPFRMPRWGGRG